MTHHCRYGLNCLNTLDDCTSLVKSCFFPLELGKSSVEELLSIRAVVISTAPAVTRRDRLANALLGQLAFTTSEDVCHKALAFFEYLSHPEYPPSVSISLVLPRALASEGILPTGASGWLPAQSKLRAVNGLLRSTCCLVCDRRSVLYAEFATSGTTYQATMQPGTFPFWVLSQTCLSRQ